MASKIIAKKIDFNKVMELVESDYQIDRNKISNELKEMNQRYIEKYGVCDESEIRNIRKAWRSIIT